MSSTLLAGVTTSPAGIAIAFGAGIASFLSPCVLPLVPGYCSMVTGLSAANLASGGSRRRVLAAMGAFVAGFTVVFVALGVVASSIGRSLSAHKSLFAHLSGGLIVTFGLLLFTVSLPASFWQRLGAGPASLAISVTRERRFATATQRFGSLAGFIFGMAFAFAWTPCIGPVLGSVLALAAQSTTLVGGMVLLLAYSAGLAVPFLLAGLGIERITAFSRRYAGLFAALQIVGSLVLIVFGILLLTDQVSWLSSWFSKVLIWLHLTNLTTS